MINIILSLLYVVVVTFMIVIIVFLLVNYNVHVEMTSDDKRVKCKNINLKEFKIKFLESGIVADFKYQYSFHNNGRFLSYDKFHASIIQFDGERYKAKNPIEFIRIQMFCKNKWLADYESHKKLWDIEEF